MKYQYSANEISPNCMKREGYDEFLSGITTISLKKKAI